MHSKVTSSSKWSINSRHGHQSNASREDKTTTAIRLANALNQVLANKNQPVMGCMREPSLGPVFGLKAGATGDGHSQVVPMEDVNLHLTGDFHAISRANNLLVALTDNHIYQGSTLAIDPAGVTWRRCVDMNDRALRDITVSDHNKDGQSFDRQTGFDKTVASEITAIFCLAITLGDLQTGLGNIKIGLINVIKSLLASELQAEGAIDLAAQSLV
jgi:formate--tetrahydrofolate ligase